MGRIDADLDSRLLKRRGMMRGRVAVIRVLEAFGRGYDPGTYARYARESAPDHEIRTKNDLVMFFKKNGLELEGRFMHPWCRVAPGRPVSPRELAHRIAAYERLCVVVDRDTVQFMNYPDALDYWERRIKGR